ncbi:MAG: 16S rRNA (adenine(1518)-N(6)/adenine(1519)-N(6))-dimethyltransferase RsmA [Candidatus Kapaibacteriota bacterium]
MISAPSTPKKSLGQNFLVDANIARKIINSLELSENDLVLEIGPGKGILTQILSTLPIYYLGVEIDRTFQSLLRALESSTRNKYFNVLFQDYLLLKESEWFEKFKQHILLVGNIPYYLTSSILFKFIEQREFYKKAVLMLQREVANRIIAKPKTKDYGILSVLIQIFTHSEKLFDVPPSCFIPTPKVFSTVVKMEISKDMVNYANYQLLKLLVKVAFNRRRKVLLNSLFRRLNINENIISKDEFLCGVASKRAEELNPNDFLTLVDKIKLLSLHYDKILLR